jgi:hypothetical protein
MGVSYNLDQLYAWKLSWGHMKNISTKKTLKQTLKQKKILYAWIDK